MSPEERDLTKLVDDHGGPDVVMHNESLLREIFESRTSSAGAGISAPERKTRHGGAVVDEFRELQKELQEDVHTAVRESHTVVNTTRAVWTLLVKFRSHVEMRRY